MSNALIFTIRKLQFTSPLYVKFHFVYSGCVLPRLCMAEFTKLYVLHVVHPLHVVLHLACTRFFLYITRMLRFTSLYILRFTPTQMTSYSAGRSANCYRTTTMLSKEQLLWPTSHARRYTTTTIARMVGRYQRTSCRSPSCTTRLLLDKPHCPNVFFVSTLVKP